MVQRSARHDDQRAVVLDRDAGGRVDRTVAADDADRVRRRATASRSAGSMPAGESGTTICAAGSAARSSSVTTRGRPESRAGFTTIVSPSPSADGFAHDARERRRYRTRPKPVSRRRAARPSTVAAATPDADRGAEHDVARVVHAVVHARIRDRGRERAQRRGASRKLHRRRGRECHRRRRVPRRHRRRDSAGDGDPQTGTRRRVVARRGSKRFSRPLAIADDPRSRGRPGAPPGDLRRPPNAPRPAATANHSTE